MLYLMIFLLLTIINFSYSMEKEKKLGRYQDDANMVTRIMFKQEPVSTFDNIDPNYLKYVINLKTGQDEDTLLHEAAKNDNLEFFKKLLEKGAKQKKNKWGWRPIHYAAAYSPDILDYLSSLPKINFSPLDKKKQSPIFYVRGFRALQLLIERGLSVFEVNKDGQVPLFTAFRNLAENDVIMKMIFEMTQINATCVKDLRDNEKNNLLHFAAEFANSYWVEKFLQLGIPINGQNGYGDTPLICAIRGNNVENVTFLLQKGADVELHNTNNVRPLYKAADSEHAEMVKLLLASNAQPNTRNGVYARTPLLIAVLKENVEIIAWLLAAGADKEIMDLNQVTPHTLAQTAKSEVVELFTNPTKIEPYKAQLIPSSITFVQEQKAATPLHMAARYDWQKIESLLQTKVVSVDCRDAKDQTPLHWAIRFRKQRAVEILLTNGASLTAVDSQGQSALLFSIRYFPEIFDLLVQKGAPCTETQKNSHGAGLMHFAAAYSTEILQKLLSMGFSIEIVDSDNQTPLYYAIESENEETFDFLIAHGANLSHEDKEGQNPLIFAAGKKILWVQKLLTARAPITSKLGRTTALHNALESPDAQNIILLLLKAGLPIESRNNGGLTPLMVAAQRKHLLIEFLVTSCKASLELEGSNQNRSIHYAAQAGNADAVEILIKLGADPTVKNRLQATPFALAYEKGHKSVLKILRPYFSDDDDKELINLYAPKPALHIEINHKNQEKVEEMIRAAGITSAALINARGPLDRTAMHCAGIAAPNLIPLLHQHGGKLEETDSYGATPLHCAAVCSEEGTKAFITLKVNLDSQDKNGDTPGHYAARSSLACLKLLIEAGIDTAIVNKKGQTVTMLALTEGKIECSDFLIRQGIGF
jgi:ankyrin repeat protein